MELGRAHSCSDNASVAQKMLVSKLQAHNVLIGLIKANPACMKSSNCKIDDWSSILCFFSESNALREVLKSGFNGTINAATVAENKPHYRFRVSCRHVAETNEGLTKTRI